MVSVGSTNFDNRSFRLNDEANLNVYDPAFAARQSAVFEDDGETGYFYAVDRSVREQPIQDALHIYNVASVTDKVRPSTVKIGWADDGLKAVLLINDYPHAVFDFAAQQGYCRTGFPPPGVGPWSQQGHEWNEACIALFMP